MKSIVLLLISFILFSWVATPDAKEYMQQCNPDDTLKWQHLGNIILLKDTTGYWRKEAEVDFQIKKIKQVNDSTVLIWNRTNVSYIYTSNNHQLNPYYLNHPIQSFLEYPVQSLYIIFHASGCFYSSVLSISYEEKTNTTLACHRFFQTGYSYTRDTMEYNNKISTKELNSILSSINNKSSRAPSIKDFKITQADINNYLEDVDKFLKLNPDTPYRRMFAHRTKVDEKYYEYTLPDIATINAIGFNSGLSYEYKSISPPRLKMDKDFYYNVPKMLDTLSNETLKAVLDQHEGILSTENSYFTIRFINTNNDTLRFTQHYHEDPQPWNLPWQVNYKGEVFTSYDIDFSRFIVKNLPDTFTDVYLFDNRLLLMDIADYLFYKSKE